MSSDIPHNFEDRLRQRASTTMNANTLETIPVNHRPHENIPNTPLSASTISFLLGCIFSLGLTLFLTGGISGRWWATSQLGFFLAAWSGFHWGEFAVTAGWNRDKCSVDSFLLDNGPMYHVANGTALVEYLITLYFKPSLKAHPYISTIGIIMTVVGQTLRAAAMIQASTNFSHIVAFRKLPSHQLVTHGVYSIFRHPSYAGFFYWALGTQLVLQNPVSSIGFVIVLWNFFSRRIKAEEKALVNFFGKDYETYRRRVGTNIPFIR
ncbi:Isoprenylcysteine carboxyl methyltransferase family-domain-containing protein [Suillus paluster]|uniref:Isoprenylcysteine carboxyl methyltransferase family-domain-containing protein n=1 Tax=Suillus paluster TaxID=48578 RepID=UPI001B85F7AE|nr:Isoprenylcysteine carboxyl methyltransferase family-domain-containing protein [Suillus paluster]KAG1752685.1 Isoprenylcysteine carboxyl methyltransferase family-domain-containing protein [Suillus paluster]